MLKKIRQTFASAALRTRCITAFTLLPIIFAVVYMGGILFSSLLVSVAVFMAYEWNEITKKDILWKLLGAVYIIAPIASVMSLRYYDNGLILVYFLLFIVWGTDTGAYFSGIIFGGPKIAPSISPSKTWAGTGGGIVTALLISMIFEVLIFNNSMNLLRIGLFTSIAAIIGDLVESYLKRYYHVKDSGSILPGHGGFLDRMDSLVFAAPTFLLLVYYG
jgi:phosphatidate cytidylyltransferase